MRRLVLPVAAALGLLAVGAGPASAEPAPAGGTKAAPGKKVCAIENRLLDELSGLVATDDGYVVINDGTDSDAKRKIFFLDKKCAIDDEVPYPNIPRDPEDLVLSPDGKTLWIADIGDNVTNTERRKTVALWTMPANGSKKPVIHRVTYPDGKHDAEALLLTPDNKPIIVTKEIGRSGLYMPTAALKPNDPKGVPMERIGEFTVPASTTPTGFIPGRVTVTGGAVAPGGGKVVLRTYSDAYEWDVTNGDVAAALKTRPRVTPLPDETFGEAIAYTPDGKQFLTVSDLGDFEDSENPLLRYTPVTQVFTASANQPGGAAEKDDGQSWFDKLSLSDITYLVAGIGALGAVLVGMGVFGIMRGRKRPPEPAAAAAAPAKAKPAPVEPGANKDDPTAQIDAVKDDRRLQAAGQGQRGAVYGAGSAPAAPKGAVYGGVPAAVPPAPPPAAPVRKGGGVYGDRNGQPGVYGSPPPPPPPPPATPPGVYGGSRQTLGQPGAGAGGPAGGGTYGGVRRGGSYAGQPYEPGYHG